MWPAQSGSTPVPFDNLPFNNEFLQQIVHKIDLNDLNSYKNVSGQRDLVYHKQ